MLEDFLIEVQVLVSPSEREWVVGEDEFSGEWLETKPAKYRTQTVLGKRPETKAYADVHRVTKLGKPQKVIDLFTAMWQAGVVWDWCADYIAWENDMDTWNKWEATIEYDSEGIEISRTEQPTEPTEPVRPA
jgi:hypothetical protein